MSSEIICLPRATGALRNLLKFLIQLKLKPRAVIGTNPSWPLAVPFLIVCKALGIKYFCDCQDIFYFETHGFMTGFVPGESNTAISRVIRGYLRRTLETVVLRYADLSLFTSVVSSRVMSPIHRGKSLVVPIGYPDLKDLSALEPNAEKQPITILYAGKGHRREDLDVLLESFAAISEIRRDIQLVLIGIEPNLRRILMRVAELGISRRTKVIPRYSNFASEFINELKKADVLALPAGRSPLVEMSARFKIYIYLMVGKPIVATKTRALEETLGEGSVCFVPPGDIPAFTTALLRILDNPDLAKNLSEHARSLFLANYNTPGCYEPLVRYLKWPDPPQLS